MKKGNDESDNKDPADGIAKESQGFGFLAIKIKQDRLAQDQCPNNGSRENEKQQQHQGPRKIMELAENSLAIKQYPSHSGSIE